MITTDSFVEALHKKFRENAQWERGLAEAGNPGVADLDEDGWDEFLEGSRSVFSDLVDVTMSVWSKIGEEDKDEELDAFSYYQQHMDFLNSPRLSEFEQAILEVTDDPNFAKYCYVMVGILSVARQESRRLGRIKAPPAPLP
jgi:hypothetical protein